MGFVLKFMTPRIAQRRKFCRIIIWKLTQKWRTCISWELEGHGSQDLQVCIKIQIQQIITCLFKILGMFICLGKISLINNNKLIHNKDGKDILILNSLLNNNLGNINNHLLSHIHNNTLSDQLLINSRILNKPYLLLHK